MRISHNLPTSIVTIVAAIAIALGTLIFGEPDRIASAAGTVTVTTGAITCPKSVKKGTKFTCTQTVSVSGGQVRSSLFTTENKAINYSSWTSGTNGSVTITMTGTAPSKTGLLGIAGQYQARPNANTKPAQYATAGSGGTTISVTN